MLASVLDRSSSRKKKADTTRLKRPDHSPELSESAQSAPSQSALLRDIRGITPHASNEQNRTLPRFGERTGAARSAAAIRWPIQAKLEIGASNDPLELEADQAADQVMRSPRTLAAPLSSTKSTCSCGGTCPSCRSQHADKPHHDHVHPQLSPLPTRPAGSGATASPLVHEVLNSPGHPMDTATRSFMESRFGQDFSAVRLHTGDAARTSAEDMGARAYTVGPDIVFRDPSPSRRLLAHELAHVVQQSAAPAPLVQRDDKDQGSKSPDLATRLTVIEDSAGETQSRLYQILHAGGPIPEGTKVIGAARIEIEGYTGPKEMRAISGADTDGLGANAPVYHASSPNPRTLSATRSIAGSGPRRDFPFSHINDAEMKIFEDILARIPKDAKGTIHFATIRVRTKDGKTIFEPYPACSGCIRASFEAAGAMPNVDLVSHAPVHTTGTANMGNPPATGGQQDEIRNPQNLKPGSVNPSPRDADIDPSTGQVIPGPNTDAARQKYQQNQAARKTAGTDTEPATVPPTTGRYTGAAISVGTTVATLGLGWLAGYLKQRVDQKIMERQIAAFLHAAQNHINANPDGALKAMMAHPYTTIYAWLTLDSSVISTIDVAAGEPAFNDSSPILNLARIDYATGPVPPELANGFPRISGGGLTIVTTRTIVIDFPIEPLALEDLISFSKIRSLPLNDLHTYALNRYQDALSLVQLTLETKTKILEGLKTTKDAFNQVDAAFKQAQKLKDVELQKELAAHLTSIADSSTKLAAQLAPADASISDADKKLAYWQGILNLVKP